MIAASTPPSIKPNEFAGLTIQSNSGNCSKNVLATSTFGKPSKYCSKAMHRCELGSTRNSFNSFSAFVIVVFSFATALHMILSFSSVRIVLLLQIQGNGYL